MSKPELSTFELPRLHCHFCGETGLESWELLSDKTKGSGPDAVLWCGQCQNDHSYGFSVALGSRRRFTLQSMQDLFYDDLRNPKAVIDLVSLVIAERERKKLWRMYCASQP